MDVTIPCPCPEKDGAPRHESDTVTLRDTLDFHRSTSIIKATAFIESDDPDSRAAEVLAVLSEGYVLHGVERWTLRDAQNKPLEVSKANIRKVLLNRPDIYPDVVEAADNLYSEAILLPLASRASSSSPPSQTDTPTSPTRGGGQPKRPRQSKRSLTSITQTDGIETTSSSLVIASNSSQSSESAA